MASYERQRQGWEFEKTLAEQDMKIGEQQITIAEDRVRIVEQEGAIAELQTEHAEDVVEFLSGKFTSLELYDWMSGVLEGVYRFFLQQATATAKLAELQLAFERHEPPPAYIQADYWEAPSDGAISTPGDGRAPDRRGLTGSARLLQDIYQLDQYAFENEKRKLQLTRTISLAALDPIAFQRFRESGVLNIATPMELFDRDFPGHYLRLIKRVRTSVVALIPPSQGIRATLSNTGMSRVVVGGYIYQNIVVRRDPEQVALTAPMNASGLFELEPQPELLLPFEATGVAGTWELRMPKASNPFDYRSIADVLLTIEYTALDSYDYRREVIERLGNSVSAQRAFSFRHELADQWFDLHNPEQTRTPMTVTFPVRREDFPPNHEEITIQRVALYFAPANGTPIESVECSLRNLDRKAGSNARVTKGLANWTTIMGSPIGTWELALPDQPEVRQLFSGGQVEDILLVITYSGRTPEWPK